MKKKIVVTILSIVVASTLVLGAVLLLMMNNNIDAMTRDKITASNDSRLSKAEGIMTSIEGVAEQTAKLAESQFAQIDINDSNEVYDTLEFFEDIQLAMMNQNTSMFLTYLVINPDLINDNELVYQVNVMNDNGDIYYDYYEQYKDEFTSDNEDVEWFFKPIENGSALWMDMYEDAGTGEVMISYIIPLELNGEVLGVFGIDLLVDIFSDAVMSNHTVDGSELFMVDSNLNYVQSEDKAYTDTFDDGEANAYYETANELVSSPVESSVIIEKTVDGKKILMGASQTYNGFYIGEIINYNDAMADVRTSLVIGSGIVLAGIVLAVLVSILMSSILTKGLISQLKKIVTSTSQVNEVSKQVSASSHELSAGSSEQAASIEEISATMDETNSMLKMNLDRTHNANSFSEEATKTASEGQGRMSEMQSSMEELKKSSAEISKIINVIDDIAFQTNMLALNAAVEAARAGDAGQGFAVVAEEVRNLAQKSAQAAKETSDIIERNIHLSEQGVKISNEISVSFNEIMKQTGSVNQLMEEISTFSDEQAKGIAQISLAIVEMEKVIQNNAGNAEESSSAAENLHIQAENMTVAINKLYAMVLGNKEANSKVLDIQPKNKNE